MATVLLNQRHWGGKTWLQRRQAGGTLATLKWLRGSLATLVAQFCILDAQQCGKAGCQLHLVWVTMFFGCMYFLHGLRSFPAIRLMSSVAKKLLESVFHWMYTFQVHLKAIYTASHRPWNSSSGPAIIFLPTSVKQAHHMDDILWTSEHLPVLLVLPVQKTRGPGSGSAENSRHRPHRKVCEGPVSGKICILPKTVITSQLHTKI